MKKSNLFYTNLTYFIMLALFIGVRILMSYVDFSFLKEDALDLIFTVIIQVFIMFLLPLFAIKLLKKKTFKQTFNDFNVRKVSFNVILLSVLIGVCAFFLTIAVSSFFSSIISFFGYERTPSVGGSGVMSLESFLIGIVTIAILPAVFEEFAHRGFLMSGYSSLGLKRAVVLSSIMFGLMHLNINQVFYATIIGFLMAITVVMSKSIIPAIIIHFLNNFLTHYLTFAEGNGLFGGQILNSINNYFANFGVFFGFVVSFLVLLMLVLLIFFLFSLLLKETRIKKLQKLFNEVVNIGVDPKSKDFSKDKAYNSYLENLTTLNKMFAEYNFKKPTDLVFTVAENRYTKPTFMENVFFYGSIILATAVTVFTFVWGLF